MADSPAAPPDVLPSVRLDDLPVVKAETEMEPRHRIFTRNAEITNHIWGRGLFGLAALEATAGRRPG